MSIENVTQPIDNTAAEAKCLFLFCCHYYKENLKGLLNGVYEYVYSDHCESVKYLLFQHRKHPEELKVCIYKFPSLS